MNNTEEKQFTERSVTISLYWKLRSSSDLLLPRYTPKDWWECDLWRLTKSGYVDEYEIKLSVSDFRADALKTQRGRMKWSVEENKWLTLPERNKHQILSASDGGPNRFWYVVPRALRDSINVPEYAGLILATRSGAWVDKEAPKRHRNKWEGDRSAILEKFYHRYWTHETKSGETDPFLSFAMP